MKIALFASWYYWRQRPHHFVDAMVRLGHEVDVYSMRSIRSMWIPAPQYSGCRIHSSWSLPAKLTGVGAISAFQKHREMKLLKSFFEAEADLRLFISPPTPIFWPIKGCFVYDCADDWAGFHEGTKSLQEEEIEGQLCERATKIWVVSRTLQAKLSKFQEKVIYVPNGVQWDHFVTVPTLQNNHRTCRPTALYIGALQRWFDAALIGKVARLLPGWDFLLAGPNRLSAQQMGEMSQSNVKMIGLVDYEYLPEVLARANVGIIPFEDCDLVRSTSPIKMYEYLAAGLPVVTTPIPEAEALAAPGILRVATTAEGFASALEDSLSGGMVEERQEIAKAYSWDRVFGKALEQTMRAPSR